MGLIQVTRAYFVTRFLKPYASEWTPSLSIILLSTFADKDILLIFLCMSHILDG